MTNLAARNALYCLIPAVILVSLSWYFYLKKKKKPGDPSLHENASVQIEPNHELDSSIPVYSSIENASDFSNTLSDASSISSPENSVRNESLSDTPNEGTSNDTKDVFLVTNHNHVEHLSFSDFTFYKNDKHVSSNCNSQIHKADSIVAPLIENELDSGSFGNIANTFKHNMQIDVPEDASEVNVTDDVDVISDSEPIDVDAGCDTKCNNGFHVTTLSNSLSEAKEEQILNVENSFDVIEEPISKIDRNFLNSIHNDQNSHHLSDSFKLSEGDSHSSVLDENSLSSMSDGSDRQADFKCKDSPSSVLDGNSISDESEKMSISNAQTTVLVKSEEKSISKEEQLSADISGEKYSVQLNKNSFLKTLCGSGLMTDIASEGNVTCDSTASLQNYNSFKSDNFQNSVESCLISPDESTITVQHNNKQTLLQVVDSCKDIQKLSSPNSSNDETISSASEEVASSSLLTSSNQPDGQSETATSLLSCDTTFSSSPDETPISQKVSSKLDVPDQLNSIFPVHNNSSETLHIKTQDNLLESSLSQSKVSDLDVADMKSSVMVPGLFVYEFDLPQELCGRLIGKQGKHVKSIKERTNANVFIKRHPFDNNLKTVVVEGSRTAVYEALDIIRRKFPPSQFPNVSLIQTNMMNTHGVSLPESLQLHLPEGASCDVILSSLTDAGHFYLQQPTHPTYPSLSTLDQCMINCYSQMDTPPLPHPVEAGVICAAPVMNGWFRAQVIYVHENGSDCDVKFVDYGGVSTILTTSLRQIRSDFMTLPFQASECYLANVRPVGDRWSDEATSVFEELAQGQILQALLIEYAEDGIPCVQLYRVQGISNMFINRELVDRGHAVWVNNSRWDPN